MTPPPPARLEVTFDAELWARTDPVRRTEWASIARDLAEEAAFAPGAAALHVAAPTRFELRTPDGTCLAVAEVPASEAKPLLERYLDVVRQIEKTEQGHGSARLEALDLAKRLAHDEGAGLFERRGATLGADHVTRRHLFTLLVALRVDTSLLAGLRGHRRVR